MVHWPRQVAVGLFVLPLVLGLVVAAGWFAPRESDWIEWGGTTVFWGSVHGIFLLGGAVSIETGLPLVLVRKEPKGYGTGKQLEGRFTGGERVTVIEDVVTTGGDSLRSIQALREARLDVIHLVVVLDRGEGGEANIKAARIPYSPLFRIQDLRLD